MTVVLSGFGTCFLQKENDVEVFEDGMLRRLLRSDELRDLYLSQIGPILRMVQSDSERDGNVARMEANREASRGLIWNPERWRPLARPDMVEMLMLHSVSYRSVYLCYLTPSSQVVSCFQISPRPRIYVLHSHPIAPIFLLFVFQSRRECTASMRPSRTNTMCSRGSWRTP